MIRRWLARRRLQRIVAQAASAPATVEYRKRRAAALKGLSKTKGGAA